MALWGIDLGGTKIEGIVIDQQDNNRILHRLRVPTEKQKGYHHILHRIAELVALLSQETGLKPDSIGIGTPGAFDPQLRAMKNCNTTALNGRNFPADIEKKLNIPVKVANDANCFALAETRMGAVHRLVPSARIVFGIILGTGVGGGIVIDQKVWEGHQGIAGEWGHNYLDAVGGTCYCERVGCIETVISGPALEKFYARLTGKTKNLREIVAESEQNEAANQTIEHLVEQFGKALAPVINILDPDAIVVGGGVGNIDALYQKGKSSIERYLFNKTLHTPILKPDLGDSAGVFGAAFL